MSDEFEFDEDLFDDLEIDLDPIDEPEVEEDPIVDPIISDQEDEDEPEIEDEIEEDAPEDNTSSENPFEVIVNGLQKLGKFVDVPENQKWDEDTFIEFFDNFTNEKAKAEIENVLTDGLGEEGIRLFNDIFVKKVPVKEYLSRYQEVTEYKDLDITKESNQKLVIKTYLESMNLDEEEIQEQLSLFEEKDILEEKAYKFKQKLIDLKEKETATLASKNEARIKELQRIKEERNDSIKQIVNDSIKSKEILGIPLSDKDSKELLPFMLAPAYKLPNGESISELDKTLIDFKKDPKKWVALAKLVKEDLNIKPIENKAADKKAEEVFNFKNKKVETSKKEIMSQLDSLFNKKRKY